MAQMKNRNAQLKENLGRIPTKETVETVMNVPEYNAKNRQGFDAYSISDELHLLSMLNTLKLTPQYYRTEDETIQEIKELVWKIAQTDPYLVAQMIVWSRCCGEGMRTINHLAAVLLAPFVSGQEWGSRFYGPFNKKTKNSGGCIYRLDDMSEIKDAFAALNKSKLTNAMKKGFANVLLQASGYELAKYAKTTINITNLVHPDIKKSKANVTIDDKEWNVIDALMHGMTISADTWESQNSEAGQIVAEAVRTGKLSKEKAEETLREAKNDNWESLLTEGKLGILAAVRNLRNILKGNRESVIDSVANLVKDGEKIRTGKVMPYQLEYAMTAVKEEGTDSSARKLLAALEEGMITALPNLKELLTGKTLIMIDCSGSMYCKPYNAQGRKVDSSCLEKAAILGAMLAKGTNADILLFGSMVQWYNYNPNDSLLTITEYIQGKNLGGTYISCAFDKITNEKKCYDRIFLLSDNEANCGCTRSSYRNYIQKVCDPYVYCIDLACYGTVPVSSGKVNYYYGYGYSMFDDIARLEFNPEAHIEKVKKIII